MKEAWGVSRWVVLLSVMMAMVPLVGFAGERDTSYYQMLFERKFPSFHFRSVTSAPMDGWVEVRGQGPAGARVVYMSVDGRYVLAGALFDVERNRNLTREALRVATPLRNDDREEGEALAFTLPPTQHVAENEGMAVLYFVDPECPFCQQWEQELPKLLAAGYSVSVLLYPNPKIHPASVEKSHDVWCASDRVEAFHRVMAGEMVEKVHGCEAPLAEVRAYGQQLQVTGTPFFVLPNGQKLGGFHTAQNLLALLKQGRG